MKITWRLLEAYLKCPTKCWLRSVGEQSSDRAWIEYSEDRNAQYRSAEIELMLLRIPPSESTRLPQAERLRGDGWRLAIDVLAQASHLESHVHAVERLPTERRGRPARLVVIRFFSDNKLDKDAKLLLQFDALVLSEMLETEVSHGKIVHGDNHAVLNIKTSALDRELQERIQEITALLSSPSPPDLVLIPHCSECEFQAQCRQKAIERDDLSVLSGITKKERKKLHDKGIFTVTQLSYSFRPRRRPKRLRDKPEKYRHALKALAIRQKQIHILGSPEIKIEGTPVYVDVEGLPDRGCYYLVGVRFGSGNSATQHSLWADDVEDEGKIWNEFLGLLAKVENPVLIHYGSYEAVWLKRMSARYGAPPAASAVARALKTPINLLAVIFAQVYFPTVSNRLKDIGNYMGARWQGPITSGLESIIYRRKWEKSRSSELKAALITYNRDDCAALETVATGLTQVIRESQSRPDVEFPDKPKRVASAKGLEVHSTFDSLLKSAHSNYARSRITLSGGKTTHFQTPAKRKPKPRLRRRSFSTIKGKIIRVPRRRICPVHSGHKLTASAKISQHSLLDLTFSKTGCRKTVVRYTGVMGYCSICHDKFAPPGTRIHRGQLFGWNFQAWVVYQRIALRMSYRLISKATSDLFSEELSLQTAVGFVEKFAEYHQRTEDLLLRRIMEGPIVHLDETKINISGDDQYVWVFTDGGRVVFRLRPNREAEFLKPLFANFEGTVITDFYGGYDALLCRQQKCLVHLIRDLNDDLWKCPFDDELEGFVVAVRDLLVSIFADIQRFGLKTRHLRKHRDRVDRFYRQVITDKIYARDTTTRYRKRFERYRQSLFSFLENDGVPWHNNTAERALRHLAVQRKISGAFSEKGASDYLRLLGIAQTCRFQRKSFLGFLLSKSRNVDEYKERARLHSYWATDPWEEE
jgi:predicted RecB family nuclease